MTDHVHISRFTPSRMKAEDLEAIFVQRHELADDTVERIRESALTDNKHHILLIGPRGSGKTHFVSLVYHRIDNDPALDGKLRIAWLNEDETSTSFLDVLLRIWRALQQKYPDEFDREAMQPLYDLDPDDAAKRLSRLLLDSLGKHKLLVIVENLNEVFAGIDEEGQQKLRSLIQENPVFTILATSQQLFEDVTQRTSPFFGFFQTEHLKPLSLDDAVELLRKVASLNDDKPLAAFLATPAGRARVRALHQLSGGNPRIYITLSQFVDRNKLDELVTPFEKMLDELTPYYQHRIDRLAPQQRKIVEFLCTRQHPVPVKEIARKLFATNQTISTQLKDLRERRYVVSHQRGRESLYELTEPLMRMSYEVKEKRREPIRLIVDFLRIWYERDELASRLASLPADAELSRQYVTAALKSYETDDDDPRIRVLLDDLEKADEDARHGDAIEIARDLVALRGTAEDWIELGYHYGSAGDAESALGAFDKAIEIDPKDIVAWNNRTIAMIRLKRLDEALDSINKAIEIKSDDVPSLNNRAFVLVALKRFDDALQNYDRVLAINPKAVDTALNRPLALMSLGRWQEGWEDFESALHRHWPNRWNYGADTRSLVEIVLNSTRDSNIWKERVNRLLRIYAKHGPVTKLGIGLVRSLAALKDGMLSTEALHAWRDIWFEVGGKHPELSVALRMFDVGIRCLQSDDPQKTLLDLNVEERGIVAEALGIEQDH